MPALRRLCLIAACFMGTIPRADASAAACLKSNAINAKVVDVLRSMTPADMQDCQFLGRFFKMKEQRLRLLYSDPRHCNGDDIIAKIIDNTQKLQAHMRELACPGR